MQTLRLLEPFRLEEIRSKIQSVKAISEEKQIEKSSICLFNSPIEFDNPSAHVDEEKQNNLHINENMNREEILVEMSRFDKHNDI